MTTATDTPADNLVDMDGEVLRKLRLSRGLTQEALARRAGISRSYVAEIERGHKRPRILIAKSLARSLKSDLDSLLGA